MPGSRSFFTEIIASISDIKFAKDGRHILSRDYMTLKVNISYIYQCFRFYTLHKFKNKNGVDEFRNFVVIQVNGLMEASLNFWDPNGFYQFYSERKKKKGLCL